MKIVVFSDSHRDVEIMVKTVEIIRPDMIIHLGDNIMDAVDLEREFMDIPMEFVKGNTDLFSVGPGEKMLSIENRKIFITHGDRYGVRSGYSAILKEGLKREADIILCGHTHIPHIRKKKGTILMNPGAIGRNARGPFKPSFGIIEIDDDIKCHFEKYSSIV